MTLDEALARLESVSPEAARVVAKELQRGYNGAMVNDLRSAANALRYADTGKRWYYDELADRLSDYANQMVNV